MQYCVTRVRFDEHNTLTGLEWGLMERRALLLPEDLQQGGPEPVMQLLRLGKQVWTPVRTPFGLVPGRPLRLATACDGIERLELAPGDGPAYTLAELDRF